MTRDEAQAKACHLSMNAAALYSGPQWRPCIAEKCMAWRDNDCVLLTKVLLVHRFEQGAAGGIGGGFAGLPEHLRPTTKG